MIRFTRLEIKNFAVFEHIEVEPSTSTTHPLTIIRGENASGKTTFLRAIRWGMYGEPGLPGGETTFGVHPAFWEPDEGGIETEVVIEFTSDGSTRHHDAIGQGETHYRLTRTVRTIARDVEPGYQRINESATLMTKGPAGTWQQNQTAVDHVIEQLLPWELRDFFVMDADEAAEYVGGTEAMTISRSEVERKTSFAVNALLGIDVFREAANRVEDARRSFGTKATRAIGDSDLNVMQQELDETRQEIGEVNEKRQSTEQAQRSLSDNLAKQKQHLQEQLRGVGAYEELQKHLETNEKALKRAANEHARALAELAGSLEAPDLIAALARKQINATVECLRPMHESGQIPQRHLGYVKHLLERGVCVCGQDLTQPGTHRNHVQDSLRQSESEAEQADFLGHLYEAGASLLASSSGAAWSVAVDERRGQLAEAEQYLQETNLEKEDIDKKLSTIEGSNISVVQEEIRTLENQINRLEADRLALESRLPDLTSREDSLNKQIHRRQGQESAAVGHRRSEDLAKVIHNVLTEAYETIRVEQVAELSSEMNRLFAAMVDNVDDSEEDLSQAGKETIRTIAEVGVRAAPGGFEIYAINNHGWDKPHIEINGASRRVIALAFVLALCGESKTRAPLIADSLLNMMSGAVRRNTLRATAERSGQPILLLMEADLEADSEIQTAERLGGATYTLTAQWHRQVVNQTDPRAIVIACTCAPRQYCNVCERIGQANKPGWTRRN